MFAVSNLLPSTQILFNEIQHHGLQEQTMLALSILLTNVAGGAIDAFQKRKIKALDPNPGDGGCQIRAYLLYLFVSDKDIAKEALDLKGKIAERKQAVNKRSSANSLDSSPPIFFARQFNTVHLSKKMEFLLQCYLLAVTRTPCEQLANGIVVTKSEVSLLEKLSKKIAVVEGEFRRKIVETAQANLSASSVELLRTEAAKLTSFPPQEKEHLLFMLSGEMTHVFTPDLKYEPKTFGCLYYECKAILFRLREEQALICFKSIVPPGQTPFRIFLQSKEPGAEFSILSEEAYSHLSRQSPVVVFEGVVDKRFDKDGFSKKIGEFGFTEIILANAAIESPYEKKSKVEDIKNSRAQEEIILYQKFAEKIECQKDIIHPMLIQDHVYCTILEAETGKKR